MSLSSFYPVLWQHGTGWCLDSLGRLVSIGEDCVMRIGVDVVERMRARIAPLDTDERRQAYREGRIPRADTVKDIDVRYRWDLYSLAWAYQLFDTGIGGADEGLTSAHIDTALRRIVPPLGGE